MSEKIRNSNRIFTFSILPRYNDYKQNDAYVKYEKLIIFIILGDAYESYFICNK
jgi:hypothetical protein